MTLRVASLFLTFFVIGFADAARGLMSLPTGVVRVPGAALGALAWMGVLAAVLVAVPAGVLAAKTGKKSTVLLGLCIAMVGDLVPVLAASRAGDLLLATFLVGAGLTCAQVAGVPMAADVSGPRGFGRTLLLAFAALRAGAALAPFAASAAVGHGWHWTVLFDVFTAAVVLAFSIMVLCRVDERLEREDRLRAVFTETAAVTLQPRVLLLLGAAGACAAVETGLVPVLSAAHVDVAPIWVDAGAALGLLAGAVALTVSSPRVLVTVTSVLGGIAGVGLLGAGERNVTLFAALSGVAFGTALPVVLILLLQSQPGRTTLASGLAFAAVAAGTASPVLPVWFGDGARWPLGAALAAAALLGAVAVAPPRAAVAVAAAPPPEGA